MFPGDSKDAAGFSWGGSHILTSRCEDMGEGEIGLTGRCPQVIKNRSRLTL